MPYSCHFYSFARSIAPSIPIKHFVNPLTHENAWHIKKCFNCTILCAQANCTCTTKITIMKCPNEKKNSSRYYKRLTNHIQKKRNLLFIIFSGICRIEICSVNRPVALKFDLTKTESCVKYNAKVMFLF